MSLERGAKLGPYEVLDALGAGGMGEVYRARDTRLNRTVAIKVLPSELSAQPELRQRLEREARAVSSLNHPHICTLYDIGRQDGVDYLVLEYLEGETLFARLKKGPLPLETALRYAVEIAEALDQAHRQGVVHRDLKPGNIMLTKSGSKLLDFGLARIREAKKKNGDEATRSLTRDLTSQGTILGTFQYMAPEQLEGKEADGRADIFAFGAVLYEMLTAHKAFSGSSQASLIASILRAEPEPLSGARLESVPPAALDRAMRVCLAKDPDQRWQSAGDLARELKWIAESRAESAAPQARKPRTDRVAWIVAAAAVLMALFVSWRHFREPASEPTSIRFTIPTDAILPHSVIISPDGAKVAFIGYDTTGKSMLWVRVLDKLYTRELPGTESAESPSGRRTAARSPISTAITRGISRRSISPADSRRSSVRRWAESAATGALTARSSSLRPGPPRTGLRFIAFPPPAVRRSPSRLRPATPGTSSHSFCPTEDTSSTWSEPTAWASSIATTGRSSSPRSIRRMSGRWPLAISEPRILPPSRKRPDTCYSCATAS